ncbi:MAG: hypothetical protein AAF531_24800 [Actinomycetota bacterium]
MSLWTPDGERSVPPADQPETGPAAQPGTGQTGQPEEQLTPEQEEQARAMAHELAEARARLLETEVSAVIMNHAFGIYELAAIHLTADEPKMSEAQLAIDALAALVEGLSGRLGEQEQTISDALHQLKIAFVQRASQADAAEEQNAPPAG